MRLKADSHPTGGRASVVTAGDGFEVGLGDSDKRSALWVRSTAVMSVWALKAAPAPVRATARRPMVRQSPIRARLFVRNQVGHALDRSL